MEKDNTVSPTQESGNYFITYEWPQTVRQPQKQQQPYPNTAPPIQRVQTNSARLASPPTNYLKWSFVNTICSVPLSRNSRQCNIVSTVGCAIS